MSNSLIAPADAACYIAVRPNSNNRIVGDVMAYALYASDYSAKLSLNGYLMKQGYSYDEAKDILNQCVVYKVERLE